MEHRKWLQEEAKAWEREGLIDESVARTLRLRYRTAPIRFSVKKPLFFVAAVGILAGIFFLCASFWNEISQDRRFFLALVPLVLSWLAIAGLIAADCDRGPKKKKTVKGNAVSSAEDGAASTVEPADISPWRLPDDIRETIGALHGGIACVALWLIHDTYRLDGDLYLWASVFAAALLILSYVTRSAALSLVAVLLSVYAAWNGAAESWPGAVAWGILALSLPQLFFLIAQNRETTSILYAWGWTAVALLLTHATGMETMWQAIFLTVAASLTWLVGAGQRRESWIGEALCFLGAVFTILALFVDSVSFTWRAPSGNILLWALLAAFLAADALLIRKTLAKKEWTASLAGISPFVAAVSALIAVFWDASGVSSGIIVSLYALWLASMTILSGIQVGKKRRLIVGLVILASTGLVRMLDSTLTLTQRGLYFLALGAIAIFILFAIEAAARRALSRHGDPTEETVETEEEDHE